jgi:Tol biopolymer transport system component
VRGSISGRRVEVLHENVECPSVSPDGTRVAYKKRVGSYGLWHVTVLDLATMRETPLAELDPIDDQIEWLDDHTVLYHNGGGIRAVPADGSGAPREFLAAAGSPSVVRPAG